MKKNISDLENIRQKTKDMLNLRGSHAEDIRVVVGMGTCGISSGARGVMQSLLDEAGKRGLNHVKIVQTGCIGLCRLEPMFDVIMKETKVTYVRMTEEKSRRVVLEHLVNGNIVKEYTIGYEE